MSDKTTYYPKNRKIILNRAKKYYENKNLILREQARNIEIYLKKKKMQSKNMEKIDIKLCLKKISKD